MKRNILTLLFSIFGLSFAFAQTAADSLVNKCLDSLGGKAKLETIHTLYEQGTYDAGGALIPVKNWAENNTASRSESIVNGMTAYTIVTRDSGWAFDPSSGQTSPEPLTASQIKQSQFDLDIQSPLLNYKQKGYALTYLGIDDELDGSDAYKLELKVNDSLNITYYIDPDSYLIICAKINEIVNGRTEVRSTFYSDYEKNSAGYIFPMETGGVKYSVIQVNPVISPSVFKPGKSTTGTL